MQRRILHLDLDAFYASVEALDNPDLAGKPLIVGGSGPRSVVCACSYEARKFGVRSAMPMRHALRRCPRAVVVPPRMKRYAEISAQIFECLAEFTPLLEKTSIDEGYMDISALAQTNDQALALGGRIKQTVRDRFQLVCSVGIAPCKFIAKIASDLRKPDALVLVPETEALEFLAPLGVEKIPGVGEVGMRKLHALEARTIAELRLLTRAQLTASFGKWGARLFDYARAIDPRPIVVHQERKSLGTEKTFDQDQTDLQTLRALIQQQAEKIAALLRRKGQTVRTVVLKIRYSNLDRITRQHSFGRPIHAADDIRAAALGLLPQTEAGRRPVRLVGISVSGFAPAQSGYNSLPLFSQEPDGGDPPTGDAAP